MYKKAEASFWTAEELDLAHDFKVGTACADVHQRACNWRAKQEELGVRR